MGSGQPLVPKATGVTVPFAEGLLGAPTVTHGSPKGAAGCTQLPAVPRLTPVGLVAGPPKTPKSAPLPLGPARCRSTVPTVTAPVSLESTCTDRFGPPRILMVAVPATESEPAAVRCSTTRGMGTATGFNPQPAVAPTFTVLTETSLVKYMGTGSVILTWI